MSTIEYNGKKIMVDDNGFLANQNDWNEEVALALASQAVSYTHLDVYKRQIVSPLV